MCNQIFFLRPEFGIFFTVDGGNEWVELDGGAPTISYRDITIQRQHDDLVAHLSVVVSLYWMIFRRYDR